MNLQSPSVSPLISVEQLAGKLNDADLLIIDTRFKLDDTGYGRVAYSVAHIPGALYMDLDQDLSAEIIPGETGRHPLPEVGVFEAHLRDAGLRSTDHVVIYDDGPGTYAARLWWMLHWVGHHKVSVLDGGLAAWLNAGLGMSSSLAVRPWPSDFVARPDHSLMIDANHILSGDAKLQLLDARAPERFRGEMEPIDPVAGHIPGATCLPCTANLGADGRWLPKEQLLARFPVLPDGLQRVCYCGSGVTACHNILAAVVAGLPMPRLYPGSWSEWITHPDRPIAIGQ
ncbi:MAG: sulfurtransferase [Pseudohongiella sp.]|nr:sulfurtransferase [Pseudohongiella sp.]